MANQPQFDFDEARFNRSSLVSEPPSLHSRESSASELSPTTPIFSTNHSRIASTCSSISCSPDARNTTLDDLLEDPEEYDLGDVPAQCFARLPSLQRKGTPTTAICTSGARGSSSSSSSRTSSRKGSLTKSMMTHLEELSLGEHNPPEVVAVPTSEAVEIKRTNKTDDIEESGLATTPLLPPAMLLLERRDSDAPSIQSPLQSPSVAPPEQSRPTSVTATPLQSNRESVVSSTEIPALNIEEEEPDEWSAKLGHANYHIAPEPYIPDSASSQQFQADWDAARKAYLEHAEHVSEDYGVTSQTYKLTEQKWAAIDAQWKDISMAIKEHDLSDVPMFEDHTTIVGPMVQYPAKAQPKPSRRASVIKYFTGLRS